MIKVIDREGLYALFKSLKRFHAYNSSNNKNRNNVRVIPLELIRALRLQVKENTRLDALEERAKYSHYFEASKCRYMCYGTYGKYENYTHKVDLKRYYKQEYMQRIKQHEDFREMHSKEAYILFEDKFYNRNDYFVFAGNLYETSKYKLLEDHTRVIDILHEYDFEIDFPNQCHRVKRFIALDDGTEFNHKNTTYDDKRGVVHMSIQNCPSAIPSSFVASMFVVNGKYRNVGVNYWRLDENDIKSIEFRPTEQHKAILKEIYGDNVDTKLRAIIWKVNRGLDYGPCRTVSKRLLSKIFQGRISESLNTKQLLSFIDMLKKFFMSKEEMKNYVKEIKKGKNEHNTLAS